MEGLGAGLAALAFWGFIAAIVVAGIWYDARKRESHQETLRRMVESGNVDPELVDRILGSDENLGRDLRTAGWIVLGTAPGLALLGLILGMEFPDTRLPLLGVSALVLCVGIGLMVAARNADSESTPSDHRLPRM
ncbi:MAG: DUF6249 domain-containing protein [Xanthomonadales bacterium]|nr:DUF6249 domain-containing protein [Xanthomonadales bacterium]